MRLASKPKTISWKETRELTIGYHNCIACGEETPAPTTEQMLEYAQYLGDFRHDTMWPDRYKPGCHPIAWSYYTSQHHTGWLCFDCTQRVNLVISCAKKTK